MFSVLGLFNQTEVEILIIFYGIGHGYYFPSSQKQSIIKEHFIYNNYDSFLFSYSFHGGPPNGRLAG